MITETEIPKKALSSLEDTIAQAMKRINASKEANLCRYIPIPDGVGFIHHLTFTKLKRNNPQELAKTIKKHILESEHPQMLVSKPRAKKGSRSKKLIEFSMEQINRLHAILKKSGDDELLALISSHQSPKEIQKRMLEMVKQRKFDPDLWEAYAQLVKKEGLGSLS